MSVWRARGDWEIELINLDGRPCWRVRRYGYHLGYCYTPQELARVLESNGVAYDELHEDDPDLR